ncbi:cytochrome P450 [Streptomyces sp. NPDC060194]|uniref:cytochrome P450 n=1 Tax=Streptomyces sp. NPDC060194 TaxID=3347069 RepID=UPI00366093FC
MTAPSHPESGSPDGSALPPPQCPAHAAGAALNGVDRDLAPTTTAVSPVGPGGIRRLYGPEVTHDPVGVYEKLRAEHGSVAPVLLHEDVPAWLVLGHHEAMHVVTTPAVYSRDPRNWRLVHDGTVRPDHPLGPLFVWQPFCSFADGAEHVRQRGVVDEAMGAFRIRDARRYIDDFTNLLVNEFCRDGRADLVPQFTEHLPMMVMCEVLGMPEAYSERLVRAARDMIKGTETALASNEFVMQHLMRLVAARRAQPTDDFTSRMLAHPSAFTDDEAAQHLRLVLIAAYETTANLMANVILMVLTDPRFRAQLSGTSMTVVAAVEQTLWDRPPFTTMFGRWAAADAELGGKRIARGDALVLGIAAANLDPAIRPDRAKPMLGNRSYLTFSGGPHECPGQDLGRTMVEIAVHSLLVRLPTVDLDADEHELRYEASLMAQHLKELPVTFEPGPPQAVSDGVTLTSLRPQETASGDLPRPAAAPPAATPPADAPQAAGAPAPDPLIPAQRGVSAPRRLVRSVVRWWRGY